MKKNYFEYTVPPHWELKEMYIVPWKFSAELRAQVKLLFEHPKYSRFRELFTRLARETDYNDMLKVPYCIIRYYQDHPQQFAHSMNNVVPHIIVAMWKSFLKMHKQMRNVVLTQYYAVSMQLVPLVEGRFLDIFLSDIETGNIIYHVDDTIKRRVGVGLKEKRVGMKQSELDYLCSFGEE